MFVVFGMKNCKKKIGDKNLSKKGSGPKWRLKISIQGLSNLFRIGGVVRIAR
jgi:hypothetical protein